MSLIIKLIVNGKEYNLIQFSYSLKQETDNFGRPNATVQCGFLNLLVDSTSLNTGLVEKIADLDGGLNGKIIYYDVISDQKIKEIEFYSGYIVFYEETYKAESPILCTEKITISAQNIRIGKNKFHNNWIL